jgi:hypothetical protein
MNIDQYLVLGLVLTFPTPFSFPITIALDDRDLSGKTFSSQPCPSEAIHPSPVPPTSHLTINHHHLTPLLYPPVILPASPNSPVLAPLEPR